MTLPNIFFMPSLLAMFRLLGGFCLFLLADLFLETVFCVIFPLFARLTIMGLERFCPREFDRLLVIILFLIALRFLDLERLLDCGFCICAATRLLTLALFNSNLALKFPLELALFKVLEIRTGVCNKPALKLLAKRCFILDNTLFRQNYLLLYF